MKKFKFLMPIGFLLLIGGISAIVMLLWNWLMPAIFGLAVINFWQALGIFALSRIFFGSFGFGRRAMMNGRMHGMGDNPIHAKWMEMTPEQRKEFINKRRRFGFGHAFGRDGFYNGNQDEFGNENE